MTTTNQLAQRAAEFKRRVDVHMPAPPFPMDQISPDRVHIANEVMWGGVWQQPGLEPRLRSIATITAQCVNGWDFGLRHQIRVGLTLGITPVEVKALLLELHFYIGVPAVVFGLVIAQGVIDERDEWKQADMPIDLPWLDTVEEKVVRGQAALRAAWGDLADEALSSTVVHELVPEAADIVDGYLYGELWQRSTLADKDRMVMILAALMCRQHLEQFRRHVSYALAVGLSREEVCQVVAQAGWYRGWPLVEDALTHVKAVFEEGDS